jgi:hypothetical protein
LAETDYFWDDLLGHLGGRKLIAVTGPDLTILAHGGEDTTLSALIARRLAEEYGLAVTSPRMTVSEVVGAFIRERPRGREEVHRLYRVVNEIITKLATEPCPPLTELAEITDLQLFISTTPDHMLARALNNVRFGGDTGVRELTFAPQNSTDAQAYNQRVPVEGETTVIQLFGQAEPTATYVLHDEDLLEWLHSLRSDASGLPEWIFHALRSRPLLFIGCDISDWFARFLVRLSSTTRLSKDDRPFFFIGRPETFEGPLSTFFTTYCPLIQHLDMDPAAFVTELRDRWAARAASRPGQAAARVVAPTSGTQTIFVSYLREDVEQARRLCDYVTTELGGDVWFDERRLEPGHAWEAEILRAINRRIKLFLPLISENTENAEEGYVFNEWRLAVERSYSMPEGRQFIIPVLIDDEPADPASLQQIPERFRALDFGRAPGGTPDTEQHGMLLKAIRGARRRSGAA